MDKTKLIAVVVVIIIVVAAAAIVLTRGGSDSGDDANIDAELRVFGNADGNYTIDRNDLSIINDIVAGNLDASDYPMADANYDGAITQADADLVQSIINGEPCTVYHYNTCTTGDYVVDTKWPVKSALATGASNMLWIMTMAGMDGMVHGITYSASSSPDPTICPEFSKMESIGGSSTKLPVDNASSYISKYDVTAVVADKTASTVDKGTVEVQYESMGVDVIRVNPAAVDVDEFCSEMFLLGFLFQTEDYCIDVAQWWTNLQDEIDSKLEGVDKRTVITCNGSVSNGRIWISAGTSDYVDVVKAAGGIYALGDEVLTDYTSGVYFNENDTWLYQYDIDCIVSIKTNDWYSGTVDNDEKYETSLGIFSNTQAYQNGDAKVIVGDAPIPIRVAYAAVALYPEVFTEEWADQVHQEFFGKFLPDVDLDWDNLYFMIDQSMLS